MDSLQFFKDILEERRQEYSNFLWVSRKLDTVLAYDQNIRPKPETHKKEVFLSQRIKDIIQKLSNETDISEQDLEHQVKLILDEIGFNKQLKTIRWLGLALAKICQRIYSGIYVNENSIKRLKAVMGHCPVIFAPSHRSYGDFILMSYICFTYDIEIPAIAAGMDFHGMWGMGSVLRDTGAFFMRRSFTDDQLYWETFKQYVHQIVTKGDLPIEFFIEGTRSRSCKTLMPKYGLLTMLLKPLFTGEIPDVFIVPINISYNRVLEEKLFAYELLGVPKPKESTSGMLKSLSIVKEKFGSIYVDFTQPISLKEYFGIKLNATNHALAPLYRQQLTTNERGLIQDIGHEILRCQRRHAVLMPFNLVALALSSDPTKTGRTLTSLCDEVDWLSGVLEQLGARIAPGLTLEKNVFDVHNGLIRINESNEVDLILNDICLDGVDSKYLKGHRLSNETMIRAVPAVKLQLYVNPCLYYFANCCLIVVTLSAYNCREISRDELFGHFRFLRSIFTYEFAFYDKWEQMEFEETLCKLESLNVIEKTYNQSIILSKNDRLKALLCNLLNPFILSYFCVIRVLQKFSVPTNLEQRDILVEAQRQMETVLQSSISVHPYSLNLDSLTLCIQSLISIDVLLRIKENGKMKFQANPEKLSVLAEKFEYFASKYMKNSTEDISPEFTSKL